ncbi:MAG: hypothetical protein JW950_01270, partial [Deltaproteobacteria bacterium]|nr:hypothetical protein [Deltaproteobacteria bacterium]
MKRSKLNRLKFRDLREVIRGFAVFLVVAVVFALPLIMPPKVGAATQAQINTALANGVAWSAAQQQAAGYWLIAPGYSETDQRRTLGTTGLALAVLGHYAEHLGKTPLSPDYAYHEHVQKGLNYIFGKAYRNAGDNRVWFGDANITWADNYSAGPILMGIVMSGAPDRVVDVPGSNVDGMTYGQVVQEIVNYLAYTQCTAGNGIGAWYYNGLSTTGDLSITGFVTLGLGYARDRFNTVVVVQPNMLTQLNQGIAFMQWTSDNPADPSYSMVGGAGYSSGSGTTGYENWINIYKVGHLLYIMDLVGDSAEAARVLRSLGFLARHWNAPNSGESGYDIGTGEWNTKVNDYWDVGWRGGPPSSPPDPLPSYIAMMATMKGLVALGVLYVGDQDWFADFSDVIVANQDVNGSWRQGGYPDHYSSTLDSQFALLTLLRAAQEDPVVDPDVEN